MGPYRSVQDRMAYNHHVAKVSKFVLVDVFLTTAHLSTHLRSSDMITSMRVFLIFFPQIVFSLRFISKTYLLLVKLFNTFFPGGYACTKNLPTFLNVQS